MDKNQVLGLIVQSLQSGIITREDVAQTLEHTESKKVGTRFSPVNILYAIGGLVLLAGIITLIYRYWSDLSSPVRILITLGLALAAHVSGMLLYSNDEKKKGLAIVMQVIGAFLGPIGAAVLLNEMHASYSIGLNASIAILFVVIYAGSLAAVRSIVFSFFTIAFGTWAVYATIGYLLATSGSLIESYDIYRYLTLVLGIAYLFLASFIKNTSHKQLCHTLVSFGSFGIFMSILLLGGYSPNQSVVWEFIGILSLIGGLYVASTQQDQQILKVTSLFIFIYIGKFTGEYFADSFGWPFALIAGGIILIAAGYGLVKFGKRVVATV